NPYSLDNDPSFREFYNNIHPNLLNKIIDRNTKSTTDFGLDLYGRWLGRNNQLPKLPLLSPRIQSSPTDIAGSVPTITGNPSDPNTSLNQSPLDDPKFKEFYDTYLHPYLQAGVFGPDGKII